MALIAGVKVGPGKYSIYSVPNEKEWEIIVNRSTSQWGHESTYTKEVQAQEVGRGKAQVQKLTKPVETFTIVPHPAPGEAQHLYLDWETTRVVVPVKAVVVNALVTLATVGLLVGVFQREWFGLFEPAPINVNTPVVMFGLLFGLSTDYEVIIVGRIRERYRAWADSGITGLTIVVDQPEAMELMASLR